MFADGKEKIKRLYKKIKSVKNIEIIFAIIIIAVMILVYSGISRAKAEGKTSGVQTTVTEASVDMEKKLSQILSQIEGAGEVSVLINYDGTSEKVTASTRSVHNNTSTSGGSVISTTTTETETPVLVNGDSGSSPYILEERMPEVIGVIIVAEGAGDPTLRLQMMRAVQTALNIDASKIEIFAKK